ncbi:hypothetical protein VTO42DRAFT_6510 [Malbranchea cinnamomea]
MSSPPQPPTTSCLGTHGSATNNVTERSDDSSRAIPSPTSGGSSRRHHRFTRYPPPPYGYYYNSFQPFIYAPSEIFFHDPPRRRSFQERDAPHGSELRSDSPRGRSRRRHHEKQRRSRHRRGRKSSYNAPSKGENGFRAADGEMRGATPGHNAGELHHSPGDVANIKVAVGIGDDPLGDGFDLENSFPFTRRRESITSDDVKRQREKRRKMERSNRDTLSTLATLSTNYTRRLDAAYYNLLETTANLRSAISSFKNLTNLASDLHSEFAEESSKLEREHGEQIAGFQGFQSQIHRLQCLEERMQKGKERARMLDERLERVREKIEAWDRRELEWQARVTRRLRIMWGVMAMLAVLFAAFRLFELIRPAEVSEEPSTEMMNLTNSSAANQTFQDISIVSPSYISLVEIIPGQEQEELQVCELPSVYGSKAPRDMDAQCADQPTPSDSQEESEDPLVRLFDEL